MASQKRKISVELNNRKWWIYVYDILYNKDFNEIALARKSRRKSLLGSTTILTSRLAIGGMWVACDMLHHDYSSRDECCS